jgi:GT2 family glycosyltransferase
VTRHVPRYATVIVATKGDPELLNLNGRIGWHFPRTSEGGYAGYYPGCSLSAIAHLEALRAEGGQYFLLPATAFWWLDHYVAFRQHLETYYPQVWKAEDICAIYPLNPRFTGSVSMPACLKEMVEEFQTRFLHEPAILDWRSGISLSELLPNQKVFRSSYAECRLPYLEKSIDIVVTDAADAVAVCEARRVASKAVVVIDRRRDGHPPIASIEWIADFSQRPGQSVSIIIPCQNERRLTDACLGSLRETLPRGFEGEILVVDDASTDDTPEALRQWMARDPRVRVLRNDRNLGFVDSCNRAAREAWGELLIFLNNDVVLLPGWLAPLLRLFRDFPQAGAAGGKLIFPDGTLQEAGGVVFRDGSAMNVGRGETDLEAPLLNFVREVDYCSGALLATPRALFKELGGFDPLYRPGYYEDTDYCFKLRSRGYRVYYQPESAVVHREGATAVRPGGMKESQMSNRAKFVAQWQPRLGFQPVPPAKLDARTLRQLVIGKPNETH